MRPTIVEWLRESGHAWLAALIPVPGLVYAILFIALALLFLRRAPSAGIGRDRAIELLLAGGAGAAIGTRLFYLVVSGRLFEVPVTALVDPAAGTASWGAYLGAMAGVAVYAAITRTSVWTPLDLGASCAGLGDVIGRWSCYLAGDDFGRVTDVAWGVRYPAGSLAHDSHVAHRLVDGAATASLPVHPFQLYLAANGLLVLLIVSAVWRRYRHRRGYTTAAFCVVYGGSRFWWELLRDPDAGGAAGLLSSSQWTCLALIAGGLLVWRRSRDRDESGPAPTSSARPLPGDAA